jgi:hypothetical protein
MVRNRERRLCVVGGGGGAPWLARDVLLGGTPFRVKKCAAFPILPAFVFCCPPYVQGGIVFVFDPSPPFDPCLVSDQDSQGLPMLKGPRDTMSEGLSDFQVPPLPTSSLSRRVLCSFSRRIGREGRERLQSSLS